jgi:CheY-like chemotaxis protein
VADHGVGIPKENITKIFEPWFTTKQAGTGLGLTSVLSIIKKHDGYIDVHSEPGTGTIFFIYLPSSNEVPLTPKPCKIDLPRSETKKILLMDDDVQILYVVQALLRKRGFEVIAAKDGAEAIKLYTNEYESGAPFDVVITDLTVPGGMGGEECMRHLTRLYPGIVAMVTSGYSDNPVMADYQSYGFCDVIEKPYKIDQLVEKLNHLIESGMTKGSRARC